MNAFSFATNPINNLWDAVAKPFQAVFVVGLCYFINRVTSPGNDWWHWVAFGMTVAVLVAWARAFKTIVLLVVAFYVGRWIYRKYGDSAKARFDDWVNAKTSGSTANSGTSQPKAAGQVLRLLNNDAAVRDAGIVH
jgi:hypothetical protein